MILVVVFNIVDVDIELVGPVALVQGRHILGVDDEPLPLSLQEDKYRREGKGRRCYLTDRIDSIPCRASYFKLRFEE